MGLRWTGGDYCADCAAAGVADAGFSQPHRTLHGCRHPPARSRIIAARTRTTLVIDETMADLWYNAPPPPPLASFQSRMHAMLTIGSAGKSVLGGTTYRLDPRQRRGPSPRLFRPAIRWIWVRRCWSNWPAAGYWKMPPTLLPPRRAYAQGAPGHVRNADGGIFSPLAVLRPPEGGLSFWVELPDMLATLFSARAENARRSISAPVRGSGWKGRSTAIYVCRFTLPDDSIAPRLLHATTAVAKPCCNRRKIRRLRKII